MDFGSAVSGLYGCISGGRTDADRKPGYRKFPDDVCHDLFLSDSFGISDYNACGSCKCFE